MSELERFKSCINLTEYAASEGYALDRKESSRNSVVMRHPSGDKVIIARGFDRHWIYFSVRDDRDNGTILDFIQTRKRLSLGQIRKELRPWIGEGTAPSRPPVTAYAPEIEPTTKDLAAVIAAFSRMHAVTRHAYLEGRGIPRRVLEDPRFARRIFEDGRRNAVFPHRDRDGLCGYEIKNRGFTGFSKGGDKGLWITGASRAACRLVIAESAIDALSHAALFPDELARYASTAGKMNPNQPELIRAALLKMPENAELIAATDADPDGRKLSDQLEEIATEAGRGFRAHQPPEEGSDWNDRLRPKRAQFAPEP